MSKLRDDEKATLDVDLPELIHLLQSRLLEARDENERLRGLLERAAKMIDTCKFDVTPKDGSGNFNMEYRWNHKVREHDPEGWFKEYHKFIKESPCPK